MNKIHKGIAIKNYLMTEHLAEKAKTAIISMVIVFFLQRISNAEYERCGKGNAHK